MYRSLPPSGTTASHPTWAYRATNVSVWRRRVLIVAPGPPPHVPVSTERWLRHLIREAESAASGAPTAPLAIVVDFNAMRPVFEPPLTAALEQMDWAALAALIERRDVW